MKSSEQQLKKIIISGLVASLAAVSMILFPEVVLKSAQKGIALWANSVLPALLPFFICAEFMIRLGIPSLVGSFFEGAFQRIFRAPGSSAFVFIISITSGYPMGAKIIGQMRKRGELTDKEGIQILSFCSTSGPLFMLGTVGAGLLASPLAGVLISISHYISALINGIIFGVLLGEKKHGKIPGNKCIRIADSEDLLSFSMLDVLTDSILSSLKTLGIICSYIIIFIYFTDLLEITGLPDIFKSTHERGFVKGLMEMTVGLDELSKSNLIGLRLKCTIATFLISFGGFSVMAQSMSALEGLKMNPFIYLAIKLSHGLIGAATAYIMGPFILNRAIQKVALISGINQGFNPGFLMQLLFSVKMIIIIIIIFILTVLIDFLLNRRKEEESLE